jgi:diguanylate cyclase (GGDEF)-like protein
MLQDDNLLKAEALRQSDLRFRQWVLTASAAAMALVFLLLGQWRLRLTRLALQRSNERLLAQSEQDPLTGLANRRHLQRLMAERLAAGQALQGQLYLLDLDHFKRINDRYGHAAGDAVLMEVARRLQAVVREHDLVARWGGEEFLVWAPPTSASGLDALAQRILAVLAQEPAWMQGQPITLTCSIGFASFPMPPAGFNLGWEQALDLVDSAMYIAKTQGRNRAVGLHEWPMVEPQVSAQLMQDLEAAWRKGQINLTELLGPEVSREISR